MYVIEVYMAWLQRGDFRKVGVVLSARDHLPLLISKANQHTAAFKEKGWWVQLANG